MHQRQPPISPAVETLWLAALGDAGIDPEHALLYCFPGSDCGGSSAHTWLRSIQVAPNPDLVDVTPVLGDMNSDSCIDAYRVALWTDRRIEGMAALLRHELEHARQLDVHGQPLVDLYCLSIDVLNERAAGLPGGGLLYQMIPMEFDANAAASVFVRSYFGVERVNRLLSEGDVDGAAFRSLLPPPDVGALPRRMVQFLASMPDLCTHLARRHNFDFHRRMNFEWPGAGDLWLRMVDGYEVLDDRGASPPETVDR